MRLVAGEAVAWHGTLNRWGGWDHAMHQLTWHGPGCLMAQVSGKKDRFLEWNIKRFYLLCEEFIFRNFADVF